MNVDCNLESREQLVVEIVTKNTSAYDAMQYSTVPIE